MAYLNANQGILTLLFSAVVAASTLVYAILTARLVKETRLLRELETEPAVVVFITPNERFLNIVDLVIRNVGRGTAVGITWEVVPAPNLLKQHGVEIHSLELLNGLSQLAPGQEIRTTFGSSFDLLKEPVVPAIKVSARFRNALGRTFAPSFAITPKQLQGIRRVGTPAEDEIAAAVKKIAARLG
ncbi:MAG: hypothetical protein OZ948_15505 [Deltaproteobacteria bacterium]|nr:hypothetical protein [Deltaproteobacteria bacterium]